MARLTSLQLQNSVKKRGAFERFFRRRFGNELLSVFAHSRINVGRSRPVTHERRETEA